MSSANVNQLLQLPGTLPSATRCVQISIPDDREYFALFYGALDTLTDWYSYDRDTAHTGAKVARLWAKALKTIQFCPGPQPPVTLPGGGGVILPMFRQLGCLLQVSFGNDPDTGLPCWCTIYDGSLCIPNPAPGGGTTPPAGGKCQTYTLYPNAAEVIPLPFNVNSGDTITVNSEQGAGSDGTPNWYCPDGSFFIAGACAGGGSTQSTDPLPTSNHMTLLLKIGSTYYPFPVGVFTVPAGITNAPVYVQVNDTSLSDNAGTYTVQVNYCNNQAITAAWCHLDNFIVSPQGWAAASNAGDVVCGGTYNGPLGQWVSGVGWQGTVLQNTDCSHHFSHIRMRKDLGSSVNFTAEVKGTSSGQTGTSDQWFLIGSSTPDFSSGNVAIINATVPVASPYDFTGSTPSPIRYVEFNYLMQNSSPAGSDPQSTTTSIKFTGTGVNPFGSSNC